MDHYASFIAVNPAIRFGKPCVTGTRMAVQGILGWLASGMTNEDIMDDFPALTLIIFERPWRLLPIANDVPDCLPPDEVTYGR